MDEYALTKQIVITPIENGYLIEVHKSSGPVLQYAANEATQVRDIVWDLVPKG